MKLKVFLSFLGLAAIVAVIVLIKGKQFSGMAPAAFPPTAVSTHAAELQEWEESVRVVGSLRADQGVVVSTEISGLVSKIAFESGAIVEAGDLLVELDSSVEQAQLRAAEASAELANISYKRAEELRRKETISQSEYDSARASALQAEAQVDNIKAAIAKKSIRAPFTGRLGIRQVDLGEVIAPGNPIVTLQSLDPIHVDFSLPQQQLSKAEIGYTVRVKADAWPEREFEGKITAISPQIDPATRSLTVQATLENASDLLRPGMFAEVEVVRPETRSVVVIPVTAVFYQSFGDTVFVAVESKQEGQSGLIAEQRFVRLGETRGDYVAVLGGLEAGEPVVSMGAFKLSNGRPIMVDNTDHPELSLTPSVSDS
ncbi:efflux RND transporter periplasmic adaptor subunit [Pelagicoccus sp. SDUM812003]|uniref:efflux RND transporter periplasmic adaptor subunit n=1 Tax=Pelagicoccus sp. SDUM812003 TaxID=3041267 RepID=UPI00280F0631|nr:efflux RND transporter periplasmic adaptor subunit [Pelagicoccus sp. SDUM812003]MDQ8204644.1 efflux RND transporter periplasmic adaptor subunit [Pelagicoccus sp. SDUM812003]